MMNERKRLSVNIERLRESALHTLDTLDVAVKGIVDAMKEDNSRMQMRLTLTKVLVQICTAMETMSIASLIEDGEYDDA